VDQIFFSKVKINIRKIDSTIVSLSSKLLTFGVANKDKREIKYSVEINQGIPVNILFFKDNKYASEDIALPELLKTKSLTKSLNIFIFDRGIQKKATFVELSKSKTYFISRLNTQKYLVENELVIVEATTPTLNITSDQIIKFKNNRETIDQNFRLITGELDNKRPLQITNLSFNIFS
jgi:hypothetical protein